MGVAIVTGSGGLIGSESVRYFAASGLDVIGLDNDMRARFFGADASTRHTTETLLGELPGLRVLDVDIRDADRVDRVFADVGDRLELVVHTAAHTPNFLPLVETETRLELPEDHAWFGGIDSTMSIDRCTHSLFGVSKASADLMVQEYGRYFHLPTVCFRGGCLTGPNHAGAQLHGFLAFLMRCTVTGDPYTIFGYDGKQVRDNIHASDVVSAFGAFHAAPREAAVYNLGGGRFSNCSMLEAIALCEEISGRTLSYTLDPTARIGDHRWWISDLAEFRDDYPEWEPAYDLTTTLREIHDRNADRWLAEVVRSA
jgi:CDP-paratose 2-epimerase